MFAQKYSRRTALTMVAGMALGSHWSARAATYPDRPLRLVIGFPPGGPVDIVGRLVAEILTSTLKQPVVVENKPGAGRAIGLDAVAKAAPDGLTLGVGPVSSMAIMPAGGVKLPYQVSPLMMPLPARGKAWSTRLLLSVRLRNCPTSVKPALEERSYLSFLIMKSVMVFLTLWVNST